MENLTISDPPQQGGGPAPPPLGAQARPPQQQQLPAQMFTTAAQLLDLTDSKCCAHEICWEVTMGYGAAELMSK